MASDQEERWEILAALWDFVAGGEARVSRELEFCAKYNSGEITVSTAARLAIPKISRTTLKRWEQRWQRSGRDAGALGGRRAGRSGDSLIDRQPLLRDFVISMMASYAHVGAPHVLAGAQARVAQAAEGWEEIALPSARSLRRWMAAWKAANSEIFLAHSNPDGWKNRHMLALGSLGTATRPNELWELDSTPADVLLADGRYTLCGVIDVATRRARLLVSKVSKAEAIVALLRWALINWGIPEAIKTDNGRDYTAVRIDQVCAQLEIAHRLCQPFCGWQKPHIERLFKTFNHDLIELLPGYTGHNVAERQELRSRESFAERLFKKNGSVELTMTAADLQDFCDRWTAAYEHQPHAGLSGDSPFAANANYTGPRRGIEDARALDQLLLPLGKRIVTKKGLKFKGAWYIAPELGDLHEREVEVRLDPADSGRLYTYNSSGAFVCIAVAPELLGLDPAEQQRIANEATGRQRRRVSAGRRELRAIAKRQGVEGIAEEILAVAANRGKVVPLFAERREIEALPEFALAAAASEALDAGLTPAQAERRAEALVERKRAAALSAREVEEGLDEEDRWIYLMGLNLRQELEPWQAEFFDSWAAALNLRDRDLRDLKARGYRLTPALRERLDLAEAAMG